MYQIFIVRLPPERNTLSQDYMDRYRAKTTEMSNDLQVILDAVMLHPEGLPLDSFTKPSPEPLVISLARKLKLVKEPRSTYQVRGVRVQLDNRTYALITRSSFSGQPLLAIDEFSNAPRVSQYAADSYVRFVLTDDRWITMEDAVVAFARLYGVIAELLPEGHALYARAAKIADEAAEVRKRQAARR